MNRALLLALGTAAALGAAGVARAAVTGQGRASLVVEPAAAISVTNPLTLPTVAVTGLTTVNSPGPGRGLGSSVVKVVSGPIGNAALTIRSQGGDAVSMAVPESFQVIRTGGTETLTVRTNTNLEYAPGPGGVVVGGALSADTMSVNVGGALNLASTAPVTPGAYEGLLVVVVQYN